VVPLWPCVAGGQTCCSCHFRRPFFGSFFGRTKKEQRKDKEKTKKEQKNKGDEIPEA
jgi:hypothetical protein